MRMTLTAHQRRTGRRTAALGSLVALALTTGLVAPAVAGTAPDDPLGAPSATAPQTTTDAPAPAAPDAADPEATPAEAPDPEGPAAEPAASEPAAPAPPASEPAASEPAAPAAAAPAAPSAADVAPLAAGDPTLSVTLTQATGTAPFDADDAPGHDSAADDDVVRTNDTVTYTVGVRYEGAAQTRPTITFALPQGEELVSLPPFCLDGSGVTPAQLPPPVVPVTATSWQDLPSQTVSCVVDGQDAGTSLDYRFVSKVRPEVPQGTALAPVTAAAASEQVTTPATSAPVSHRVSAAATFDVSKRRDSENEASGPFYQYYAACSFDTARPCAVLDFPLTLQGPAGGKGLSPLLSPVTVTEDLRPDSFFGAGTTSSAAWTAAGAGALEKYAPRLTVCANGPLNVWPGIPYSAGGSATQTDSVRSSGTITCPQPTLGTEVDITFTDADTTGYTVPTRAAGGGALPADLGIVLSTGVRVELPLDAVRDLGTPTDGTWALSWRNTYSDLQAQAIDGTPNQGEDPSNNSRSGGTKIETGFGFTKGFSGVSGAPGNTPTGPTGYTGWEFEGPPGSGVWHDGNTVVLPGQTVLSNVKVEQQLPPQTGTEFSYSNLACDVWDDTTLAMPVTFDYAGTTVTRVQLPSAGSPAWVSSWYQDGWRTSAADLPNLRIEYGYTSTPGSGADSSCDSGTWASTPGGVPGAQQVDGTWRGVNRVRFSFSSQAGATEPQFDVNFSIALRVLATAGPNGTLLPNWASIKRVPGVTDLAGVVADPAATSTSTYDPTDNSGGFGDRLILGQAAARIKKLVANPTTGEFTDTAVPQYTAGSQVRYRLNPSLTADVAASGTVQDVVVEDCLPPYQSFVSSVRESGAAISPAVVQQGAPAGSDLVCGPQETYLRWDLGPNPVGEVIDPIVYAVEISGTVRNAVYTNTTLVTSPGDPSPVAARQDTAQIQVVVPTGIKIAKTVDKNVVEVNGVGLTNPRSFVWSIDFANIDSPTEVSDVDVIDVLPADGLGGSAFQGDLVLDGVSVTAGDGIRVLYTAAPPGSLSVDPGDASNAAGGATVWCDAATGGAVVSGSGGAADCPAGLAEVTGLRLLRAGAFEPTDLMTVAVAMTPSGNAEGDVYANSTAGRVTGVTQPVGPAVRTVGVVASSIGDRVWLDLDGDGLQDDDEPGVPDVPVTLTGTDVDGNAVERSTVTGADGGYLFADLASGTYVVTFDPEWVRAQHYAFTLRQQGADPALDSDADVTTGASGEVALGVDTDRLDVDAGLVQPVGSLVVVKQLTGAGTALAGPSFVFDVVCTSRGAVVHSGELELVRDGDASELVSAPVTGLPVGAECVVTETSTGGADEAPAPVTVTIVENEEGNTVRAVVVNTFSAGTISVAKVLDGPFADHPDVVDREFTLLVTCQVEVTVDGQPQPGTLVSQEVRLRGGQSVTLLDANGDAVLLPRGATCFLEETDAGGADAVTIEHGTLATGVVVTGSPEDLQQLVVTAVNTFTTDPTPPAPPAATPTPAPAAPSAGGPLALTGADVLGLVGVAAMLLAGGGAALAVRRRREAAAD